MCLLNCDSSYVNCSFLAIADVYRLEGNKKYKNKELLNAVYFYTEGLQVNCKDDKLNAKLYHNRATAYFYSGEISSVQLLADISVSSHRIFCCLLKQTSFISPLFVWVAQHQERGRWPTLSLCTTTESPRVSDFWRELSQSLRSWCWQKNEKKQVLRTKLILDTTRRQDWAYVTCVVLYNRCRGNLKWWT